MNEHDPDETLPHDPDATVGQTRDYYADRASAAERAGQQIHNFTLLQELGEGGFGSVWMAEQKEPVRRKVALKIIKLGMDTKQVIARFEAERQALALMDHPSIAKVYDAGTTDTGRPYFVMEYIKGVPIVEFCNQMKLGTRARLDLFVQVCGAIQHAHQKGVIHRDIKPGNVLVTTVDDAPTPKVIDFGIAKATSAELTQRTIFTEQQQVIGTPAYMAPEQAEMSGLDIDTRADVYALGVLLYEMLTGTTPFESRALMEAGFAEMLRVIREEEPKRPSTRVSTLGESGTDLARTHGADTRRLSTTIRGDLDWIVMKCLEKDRTRRYETASGLADDIHRHLTNQPVLAGPPTASYRVQKFIRRNRAGVIAASLVLGVLVLGVVGTSYGLVWALDEKERAELAESETERELVRAEAAEAEAQRELVRANEVKRLISGMLAGVTPEVAQGADTEILEQVLADTEERLASGDVENPLVEAELRLLIGGVYTNLGLDREGSAENERAFELRRDALGPDHPDTLHAEIAALGILRFGDDPDAYFLRAEPLLERTRIAFGNEDPATLNLLSNIGASAAQVRRFDAAEAYINESLETRRRLSDTPDVNTLNTMSNLSRVLRDRLEFEKAEALIRETLALREELQGPTHPGTINERNALAELLKSDGRYTEAEPLFRETVADLERVQGPTHRRTLWSRNNLANALRDFGKFEEARGILEDNIEAQTEVYGHDAADTLMSRMALGSVLLRLEETDRAEEVLLGLVEPMTRVFGEGPQLASLHGSLGRIYTRMSRYQEATEQLERSLEIRRVLDGDESPSLASTLTDLAGVYSAEGRVVPAMDTFREAHEMHVRLLGPEHPDALSSRHNMAAMLFTMRRYAEAERIHREIYEVRLRVLGEDHPYTLLSQGMIGACCTLQGKTQEGIEFAQAAADRSFELYGEENAETLLFVRVLQQGLMQQGRHAECIDYARMALDVSLAKHGDRHVDTLGDMTNLGILLMNTGEVVEGVELLERSLPIKLEVLGDQHQYTKIAMANLMGAYQRTGRQEDLVRVAGLFIESELAKTEVPEATAETFNSAAWMLLNFSIVEARDPERALGYAKIAHDMDLEDGTADQPQILDTYALALFETGEIERAFEMQQQAVRMMKFDAPGAAGSRNRLERYRRAVSEASEQGDVEEPG